MRSKDQGHRTRCRGDRVAGEALRPGSTGGNRQASFALAARANRGFGVMANWDELKQTFFEETKEGLEVIDAGLTDIRDGAESDDTVSAVFRAIHSAKGGAGVFGFEELVKFAHVFETVLDAVRHGSITPGPDILDVLFTASDVLADFVAMARSGEAAPAGY